jgi:glycosyltransferase involved in cell wall biosynthesis
MRILLVNKYYYLKSGTERYLFNLKRLLEAEGHTVAVFAMQHPRNQPATYARHFVPCVDFHDMRGLAYLRVAWRVIWFPGAAQRMAHVLDEFRPDVVHLLNIYHHLSPSILVPIAERDIPAVQTLNDYKLICPNYLLYTEGAPCTRCHNHRYVQALLHRCLHGSLAWSALAAVEMTVHKFWRIYERHVRVFIAPSAFVQTTAQTFGLPSSQLAQLPYFLFAEHFKPSGADNAYFAYVGRLSYEKGLLTLLRAMRQVPQAKLWIVGEGPRRPVLEQMADQWKLTNVHFAGYLVGDALEQALAGARFTVLPSEWYEVFGQSILESFAVGKPVVVARIGGMPELVEEGVDGLLFQPGAEDELAVCLRRLWDDPHRAKEMGLNGQRKVLARYDAGMHYAELLPLYERLVNG